MPHFRPNNNGKISTIMKKEKNDTQNISSLSLSQRFAYQPESPLVPSTKGRTRCNRVVKQDHDIKRSSSPRPFKYHISELKYAHLSPLPNLLTKDLNLLFCGFNPSIQSAETGHRFAHRSNCFWKLIYDSEIVDEKLTFHDDIHMPEKYGIGFTDLVMRPTKGVDEVPLKEMVVNIPRLIDLIVEQRPKVVCLVGRGIWDALVKVLKLDKQRSFQWGLQDQCNIFKGIKLFVVPSTSGLVRMKYDEKLAIWKRLKIVVDEETTVMNNE